MAIDIITESGDILITEDGNILCIDSNYYETALLNTPVTLKVYLSTEV